MIRLIILVVIGILALSFFGITIQSIVQSPIAQQNFAYVWSYVLEGWNWAVAIFQTNVHAIKIPSFVPAP